MQKLAAECLGTMFLVATVVGSGIMAETLSGGNVGLALLANTIAGAILYVIIAMFGAVSGAHFNPAVSVVMAVKGDLARPQTGGYIIAQIAGGVLGTWLAHFMFDVDILPIVHESAFRLAAIWR